MKSFQVIALGDSSVGKRDTSKNAVPLLLLIRRTCEKKVRIKQNANSVATFHSLSGFIRNVKAATESNLSKQLEKDRSRYLSRECQPLSDQPCRCERSVRRAVVFRLIHEVACIVEFQQKAFKSSVALWAITGRRQLAEVRKQQLVAWKSLYWLESRYVSTQACPVVTTTYLGRRTLMSKSLTVNAFRRFASLLCTGLIAYAKVSIALSYSGLARVVSIRRDQDL